MLCYSRQWLLPISERKFSRLDPREWIQCPGLRSNHWIFCHLTPETKSWKKIRLDQQLQAQSCLSPRHSSCLIFCLSRWSLCRNKNVVKICFAFFDCAKIWGDADSGAYACQARPPASNFKPEFKTMKVVLGDEKAFQFHAPRSPSVHPLCPANAYLLHS